jgi:two-component system chemotaxis response regulator CheY
MHACRSMPVLLVEDFGAMTTIMRGLLRKVGFENVDVASDRSTALAKMREKSYGLVISDWNMAPMNGCELIKTVRSEPRLAKTPFIMVTAESTPDHVIAAKKAGVDNYIVKPFNAETLSSKIDQVFSS